MVGQTGLLEDANAPKISSVGHMTLAVVQNVVWPNASPNIGLC